VAQIRSCDGVPVVCIDDASVEESEVLEFTAGAGEAGTYYVFMDRLAPDGDGGFHLNLSVSE
jgi:hypothetical protein